MSAAFPTWKLFIITNKGCGTGRFEFVMIKSKAHIYHNKPKIFTETVSINQLTMDDIAYLCDAKKDDVKCWFNGSEPSSFALMQIKSALYAANKVIPNSLIRFVQSQESRAKYWGGKYRTEAENPTIERKYKAIERYYFNGHSLSLSEIVKQPQCVVTTNTLRARIRVAGVLCGENITDIATINVQQGKKISEVL